MKHPDHKLRRLGGDTVDDYNYELDKKIFWWLVWPGPVIAIGLILLFNVG